MAQVDGSYQLEHNQENEQQTKQSLEDFTIDKRCDLTTVCARCVYGKQHKDTNSIDVDKVCYLFILISAKISTLSSRCRILFTHQG